MSPSPSALERLGDASRPVVALFALLFLAGAYLRASRVDPAFGLVVVAFLVMNGGLIALGGWAAGRKRD
ncbi:hypothetical protein SAMN04488066_11320 [Halorubrum aquaticum]|uniref:PEP-CTERM protein-sorting domain-containing protein n=2 Tax=Halorubrum aquaticum TaxID=387340 RepID=A0A1I3BJQ8_9EURY|nr:hypothetical protein [Halorubrum aquaticum]SFH62545.1 hypothetical protein SAMN04488066_11320 [Halorubrum aquaticum]